LLVNVAIVVAVVFFIGGRSESPGETGAHGQTGTPTPSASATTDAQGMPTTDISGLVGRDADLTLAVLGDGTGDEEGEWVTVLGDLLGQDRKVKVNNLDPSDPTHYARALSYGSGEHTATIWNGSRLGVSADYAAQRLEFLVPEKPDVVLLSYGRDDKADEIGPALGTTLKAIREQQAGVPVAVILQAQNTDDQIAPVRESAAKWAEANGLTTIDVAAAFRKAGDPNSFVSVVDPPSVNALGGQLWGETVFHALGGRLPDKAEATEPSATTMGAAASNAVPAPQGVATPGSYQTPAGTVATTDPPGPQPEPTQPPQDTPTPTRSNGTGSPAPTTTDPPPTEETPPPPEA
ncbi:MAG TPA: SGNH/GDSL hydrolase family protein, partial [Intrasporangium sp.]|nr:SGNH/GDSL hydrolase family protein [Intrasporangium sp.]